MAIYVPGMRCCISGRPINSARDAVTFPAFVANDADPLKIFSDAVIHAEVFQNHPLAKDARDRLSEAMRHAEPDNRLCRICGQRITDPDNYLSFGYLIGDKDHPLHPLNYAHFHRSCLAGWPETANLIKALELFDNSGAWKGDGLRKLLRVLRSEAPPI